MPARRAVLAALTVIAAVLGGLGVAGPAAADGHACGIEGDFVVAHPGRTRVVSVSCAGAQPLSATFDQPGHGTLTQITPLTYTLVADPGFTGEDAFTLRPVGNDGAWAATTIPITFTTSGDSSPRCSAEPLQPLGAGTTATVRFTCHDDEGDPVTFRVAQPPQHGVLGAFRSTAEGGEVDYTAAADASGTDRFVVAADDGYGLSDPAVTVDLRLGVDAPVVVNHAPTCSRYIWPFVPSPVQPIRDGRGVAVMCQDVDGDPLAFTLLDPPQHGSVRWEGGIASPDPLRALAQQLAIYTTTPGYLGPDAFTYRVTDGRGGDTGPRTQELLDTVDQPTICAEIDVDVVPRDTPDAAGTLVELPCTDPDDPAWGYTLLAGPEHGTLTPADPTSLEPLGTGRTIYRPDAGFRGIDHFTYRPTGATTTYTATLRVGVPPAPATAATRARRLLGGSIRTMRLGRGATAYLRMAAVRPGARAAVLDCPAGCRLTVGATLSSAAGKHGRAPRPMTLRALKISVASGHVATVRLALSGAQRRALARRHGVRATLALHGTVAGHHVAARARLSLRTR